VPLSQAGFFEEHTEAVSMDLYPVLPEIMTERISGAIPMKAGELLAARVLRIKGETMHIMLENGAVLKTRLLVDLKFQRGEELVLQVKGIRDGKIEMAVAFRKQPVAEESENHTGKYGVGKDDGEIHIIEKLIQNNLPVTPDSIKEIQRALKHIYFLRDNFTPALEVPAKVRDIDAPIEEMVRWLAGEKQGAAARQGAAAVEGDEAGLAKAARDTAGQEKYSLLMEELMGIETEDVVKLKKYGLKLSLQNLALSKNLRENKGFPGILLKTFFDEKEAAKKVPVPSKEGIIATPEKEGKASGKALEYEKGEQVNLRSGDKAEPVDIKVLLERVISDEKALPRQRVAAELLAQRVLLLEQALAGQDLCVFPFMLDGRIFECMVKGEKQRGSGGQREDVLELAVDANPPGLGRIRVIIRVCGRDIEFGFFVDKEETKSLVERERGTLKTGIGKLGFRVNRIACGRMPEKKPETGDVFLDVKV
jgi:hypothetical protein